MNLSSYGTTKAHEGRVLVLLLSFLLSGCAAVSRGARPDQAQVRAHPNLIAHVRHNEISFSVAVDQHDPAYLRIIVPERFSPSAPLPERTVNVRVLMRDDSRREGIAQRLTPTAVNAGGADINYMFSLGRRISVDDIHSVRVTIDDDTYEVFPF
ncbi:MAG: hypothetical protein AB9869_09900 [Verrucomicrobiia bacterium]